MRPLGVDLDHPFCLQLLELDRWNDPHSTIEGFRLARAEEPSLQLVLAATLDSAASEEWRAAKEVSDYVGDTPGVLLLTSYESLGSLELGGLQRLARVVLESSLGEGFGLGPCEALWRRTPVVGGTGGGLPLTCATAWTASWPMRWSPPRRISSSSCATRDWRWRWAARAGSGCASGSSSRPLPRASCGSWASSSESRAVGTVESRVKVHLPDGTALDLPEGSTGADAAPQSAPAWLAPPWASS